MSTQLEDPAGAASLVIHGTLSHRQDSCQPKPPLPPPPCPVSDPSPHPTPISGGGGSMGVGVDTYSGHIKNGVVHGEGVLTYANGHVYEGQFCDGKKHGMGTYRRTDGCVFTGSFLNDLAQGYGVMTDGRGCEMFRGTWKNDTFLQPVSTCEAGAPEPPAPAPAAGGAVEEPRTKGPPGRDAQWKTAVEIANEAKKRGIMTWPQDPSPGTTAKNVTATNIKGQNKAHPRPHEFHSCREGGAHPSLRLYMESDEQEKRDESDAGCQ